MNWHSVLNEGVPVDLDAQCILIELITKFSFDIDNVFLNLHNF